MKTIKNLKYVTLKEYDDLENIGLIYVDEKVLLDSDVFTKSDEVNTHESADVFTQSYKCDTYAIDEKENISDMVEQLFIKKLKNLQIEEIDDINKGFDLLSKNRLRQNNENKFILSPIGSGVEGSIETEHLKEHIYFGYKTDFDEPGIVLVTNEDAIKDKNNLRISLIDIGFFPNKMYYKQKINK
jgi:hypothetical protein